MKDKRDKTEVYQKEIKEKIQKLQKKKLSSEVVFENGCIHTETC